MTIKISDDDLRTMWQQRATDVPSDRSACLTDVEWARLLSKEAAPAERTRAVAHIASCTQCAEEFRLLQPLQEWSADLERVVAPPAARVSHRWTAWLSSFSSPLPAFAMAAALILMVTQGVGVYLLVGSRRANTQLVTELSENQRALSSTQTSVAALEEQLRNRPVAAEEQLKALQQRLAERSTPQLDAVVADLDPQTGDTVRGSTDNQVLTVGPEGSIVTLTLNFEPLGSRSTLEVQVTNQGGRVLWTGRTERDRATAMLTMTLPSEGYPPGRYVIEVFDVTRGRRPLATYSVTLRQAAATRPSR